MLSGKIPPHTHTHTHTKYAFIVYGLAAVRLLFHKIESYGSTGLLHKR